LAVPPPLFDLRDEGLGVLGRPCTGDHGPRPALLAHEGPLLIELDLTGVRGKSHELVMRVVGVLASQAGQANNGVAMDAHQACRGPNATSLR
jgi:hypothetical protein